MIIKEGLMRLLVYFFLLSFIIHSEAASAFLGDKKILVIRSAVPEEFKNGLHRKYLVYFADKLSAKLEISTMPFARRLHQLKTGKLDLMIGLQRTEHREDDYIYIFPPYETLKYRFYSLKEKSVEIANYKDLYNRKVGIHRHSKYYKIFDDDSNIERYPLSTLKQKIKLLLHKRIDVFVHYEESTLPALKELGLEDKIVKTYYQPEHDNQHYLVISSQSSLIPVKTKLENIIKEAIKNGDLLNIRLAHYREKNN